MDSILLIAIFGPSFMKMAHLAVSRFHKKEKAMENRFAILLLFLYLNDFVV